MTSPFSLVRVSCPVPCVSTGHCLIPWWTSWGSEGRPKWVTEGMDNTVHSLGCQGAEPGSRARDSPPWCYELPTFPGRSLMRVFQDWGMQREKPSPGSSAQQATTKRHYEGAVRGAETLDINVNMFPRLVLAWKWACVGGTPGLCHKHIWVHCCTQEPTNLTPLSTEPAQPIRFPHHAVSG